MLFKENVFNKNQQNRNAKNISFSDELEERLINKQKVNGHLVARVTKNNIRLILLYKR